MQIYDTEESIKGRRLDLYAALLSRKLLSIIPTFGYYARLIFDILDIQK